MKLKVDQKTVIVFDLDDTLVYEIDFLYSAYFEIAQTIDPKNSNDLFRHLISLFRTKENAFEFLERTYEFTIANLLSMYRNHAPKSLPMLPSSFELICEIKANNGKVAVITDGRSITQRNKIKAIGISEMLDEIIISEEINSEKPNELNFKMIQEAFPNNTYLYVGDNIKKDFIAPNRLGWNTIQILDAGKNIHTNVETLEMSKKYKPKYSVRNFSEIDIIS